MPLPWHGSRGEPCDMRHGFVIGQIGVLVGYAEFRSAKGLEAGARLELRRMIKQSPPKGSGAEPATPVTFGDPLWRVDIFSRSSGPPGNWSGAHYHTGFRKLGPGRRCVDASLTSSPLVWLDSRFRELPSVLTTVGADDLVAGISHDEWERALPGILDAVTMYMQEGLEKIRAVTAGGIFSGGPRRQS
jgi:hypothetical protein